MKQLELTGYEIAFIEDLLLLEHKIIVDKSKKEKDIYVLDYLEGQLTTCNNLLKKVHQNDK